MAAFGLRFQREQGADERPAFGRANRITVERRLEVALGMAPAADFTFRMGPIRMNQEAAVIGRVGIDLDIALVVCQELLGPGLAFVEAEIDDDLWMRRVAKVGP